MLRIISRFLQPFNILSIKLQRQFGKLLGFLFVVAMLEIVATALLVSLVDFFVRVGMNEASYEAPLSFGLFAVVFEVNFFVLLSLGFFVISCLSVLSTFYINRISQSAAASVGIDLLRFYLGRELEYFYEQSTSTLKTNILVEVARIGALYSVSLHILVRSVLAVGLVVLIILEADGYFISGFILLALTLIAIFLGIRAILYRFGMVVSMRSQQVIQALDNGFEFVREHKFRPSLTFFLNEFGKANFDANKRLGDIDTLTQAPRFLLEGMVFGGLCVVMGVVLTLEQASVSELIPELAVLGLLLLKLLPSMQAILNNLSRYRALRPVFDKLRDDLRLSQLNDSILSEAEDDRILEGWETISLVNVCYRYPGSNADALKNVSLTLKRGDKIAVLGSSGSGKSTLLDIVQGLLIPSSGYVMVDGLVVCGKTLGAFRKEVSPVPQFPVLFEGAIGENLYFMPEQRIGAERITVANRILTKLFAVSEPSARSCVERIGPDGTGLSGGQKQRLGIARGLANRRSIMIFDEPASALDQTSIDLVRSTIFSLTDSLVLIASHQDWVMAECDYAIRMREGVILDGI